MTSPSVHHVVDNNLRQLSSWLAQLCNAAEYDQSLRQLYDLLCELLRRTKAAERRIRTRFGRGLLPRPVDEGAELVPPKEGQAEAASLRACSEAARALEAFFRSFEVQEEAEFYRRLRYDLAEATKLQENLKRSNGSAATDTHLPAAAALIRSKQLGKPAQGRGRVAAALSDCPLYFILDESLCENRDALKLAGEALAAGVRIIQLRFKATTTARILDLARRLVPLCKEKDALLIINDRLDIALLSGADGLHLGADDLPLADVRALAPGLILGATVRKPQHAVQLEAEGADYIACGSIFGSKTKPDVPIVGLRGIQQVSVAVQVPVVGIGGVELRNCHDVLESGAQGFCSIRPFMARQPLRGLIQEFRRRAVQGRPHDSSLITMETL